MERRSVYRLSAAEKFLTMPIIVAFGWIGYALVSAGNELAQLSDQIFGIALGGLFLGVALLLAVGIWMRAVSQIGVVCSVPHRIIIGRFTSTVVCWEDIVEFGTFRAQRLTPKAPRQFYLKTRNRRDSRVLVCSELIEGLNELLDAIFYRAINAKFVRIENLAWVPFVETLQIVPRQRRDIL